MGVKVRATGSVRVRVYPLVSEALDAAARYGVMRAYKYKDNPTREELADAFVSAAQAELGELFIFDEEI